MLTVGYRLHLADFIKSVREKYVANQEKGGTLTSASRMLGLPNDGLLLHQYVAREYFIEKQPKGLLLYHQIGSGKTMTSVAICVGLLASGQVKGIIMIMRKSLFGNFRDTYARYTGQVPDERYHFISLGSSNMTKKIYQIIGKGLPQDADFTRLTADGYAVVVDEAHNIFAAITNGSENAIGFYNLVMRSACRTLFMSGSPAVKNPYELAMGFNMLCGRLDGKWPLLGESYDDFNDYFMRDPTALSDESSSLNVGTKNMDIFGDRITGLCSFYEVDPAKYKEKFPTFYGPLVERVPMSQRQFDTYKTFRLRERKQESQSFSGRSSSGIAMPSGASSTYRVNSRQQSNFMYPDHASGQSFNNRGESVIIPYMDKLVPDDFTAESLAEHSPKLLRFLQRLKNHLPKSLKDKGVLKDIPDIEAAPNAREGPGAVYSQYLAYGVKPIQKALERHGFVEIRSKHDMLGDKPGYVTISGENEEGMSSELVDLINSKGNEYGEKIFLLITTATGVEGLDLHRLAHEHIYEPYWHYSRHDQFFGRGDRYESHIELPEGERSLTGYVYLSDYPAAGEKVGLIAEETTTDVTLWNKSLSRKKILDEFFAVLKANAVDCLTGCRMCAPSDESLIINNIRKHIDYGSKCVKLEETEVSVMPFEYEGEVFYYMKDGKKVIVYVYDPFYNQYIEMDQSHPKYFAVLKALRSG